MGDIGKGDVVVCVDVAPTAGSGPINRRNLAQLTVGRAYRVSEVGHHVDIDEPLIKLAGIKYNTLGGWILGYKASRFQKLRPADPEFAALLKREPVEVL